MAQATTGWTTTAPCAELLLDPTMGLRMQRLEDMDKPKANILMTADRFLLSLFASSLTGPHGP